MLGRPGYFLDPQRPVNWAHPSNNGLVSEWAAAPVPWWGGGTLAYDLVRGAKAYNDGTLASSGVTWQGGARPGGYGAWKFDGAAGYIDAGRCAAALESVSAFTLSLWVRPNSAGTLKSLAMKFNSGNTQTGLFLETGISDQTSVLLGIPTSTTDGNTFGQTNSGALPNAAWSHVVMVFNGGGSGNANKLLLYVNAALQSLTFTGSIPNTTSAATSNLRFGSSSNSTRFLTGQQDSMQLYGRALSATDVQQLYDQTSRGNPDRWAWRSTTRYYVAPAATFQPAWCGAFSTVLTGGVV